MKCGMWDIRQAKTKEVEKRANELENQGIKFQLNTSVEEVLVKDNFAQLKIKNQSDMNEKLITADIVLIAVGREPNTENLGLKELGISLDEKGFIETDEKFQTSIKNIYAIGDVIKGPMLAHKAEEDGVALVELINNEAGHVDYNLDPNIIYNLGIVCFEIPAYVHEYI